MARIDDMDRRLDNWARWIAGAGCGGLGFASVNLMAAQGGDRSGYREATIPTSDCEGAETDLAVKALPSELQRTVEVFYLLSCGVSEKARRLAVTEATVRVRLGRAHAQMQSWLVDRAQQRKAQRERVELVTLAARPPFVNIESIEEKKRRSK